MESLDAVWTMLASPAAALLTAAVVSLGLVLRGYHRDPKGAIVRRKLASVIALSASSYTFGICVLSQFVLHGPSVSVLIRYGFGNTRVAWLLLGLATDQIARIWDEFRPAA